MGGTEAGWAGQRNPPAENPSKVSLVEQYHNYQQQTS